MEYRLVMLNGPTPGASIRIDPQASMVTMGRDASRDLPIDDHLASRLHARLSFEGRAWQIEDCGSLNGTLVNSQPVQRAVLQPGDRIRIGDRIIVLLKDGSVDSTQAKQSVFSKNTRLIRISSPSNQDTIFQGVESQTVDGPVRQLALLCRLATSIHALSDTNQLVDLVCQSLQEATSAGLVNVWLAGQDGRLKRAASSPASLPLADNDHLLASVVMENNEGLLVATENPSKDQIAGEARFGACDTGKAMAVPVAGPQRARGALECHQPADGVGFDRGDLEFAVAIGNQFGMALENLEYRERLEQTNEQLRRRVSKKTQVFGNCPEILHLHDQISRVAPTSSTVMVLGESGTGKELVSRTIHEMSSRSSGPFVAVNCAAFSESLLESELFGHEPGAFTGADQRRLGQFERAHRGTIFLDEVAEMSPACQAKLLRLLEGHSFHRLGGGEPIRIDVRVVSATHSDLREMVKQNRFREDLFYRLRVIELHLPPLRERGDDILDMAVMFLEQYRRDIGRGPRRLSREAAEIMMAYPWPGNVRELRNAVERAVVLCQGEELMPSDLGLTTTNDNVMGDSSLVTLDTVERRHIQHVLKAVGGNKTRACDILGIGRGTLYKKLEAQQQSARVDS